MSRVYFNLRHGGTVLLADPGGHAEFNYCYGIFSLVRTWQHMQL